MGIVVYVRQEEAVEKWSEATVRYYMSAENSNATRLIGWLSQINDHLIKNLTKLSAKN